jgi:DNA-binding transcriptional MerR regulator
MDGYSAQDVTKMLGLTPGRLRAYLRAGFLSPERGEHGKLQFSFRDLLLLRTAEGLVAERIPPRRVLRALKKLRERVPEARPLTELHLRADGDRVVVRDGDARWQPESGQVLLSFPDGSPPLADAPISAFPPRGTPRADAKAEIPDVLPARDPRSPGGVPTPAAADPPPMLDVVELSADELHRIGCSQEEADPRAAERTYRRLLEVDPDHPDGHINLGRLLHEAGQHGQAEEHYRRALELRPGDATAAFNLAVVIEDQGRVDEALAQYEKAVTVDGHNPDAHFNAARLYEKAGKHAAAIRHLRAYRELTR